MRFPEKQNLKQYRTGFAGGTLDGSPYFSIIRIPLGTAGVSFGARYFPYNVAGRILPLIFID